MLHAIFLLSGFAALLYQVVWQRALFAIFGIDIASVTIVVTAFMLGLGIGSLVGGALSRRPTGKLLPLFALLELLIGVFGLISISLFASVAEVSAGASYATAGITAFLLVILPTGCMGATLPLLVQFATRRTPHVGRAVSSLYFVNTLGAAFGSFAAATLLLRWFGLHGATRVAAGLNLALAVAVYALHRRDRRRQPEAPA